jgi:single-stranded DNA-binding protein
VNNALIVGRVSKTGPKLSYASNGTPTCSLVIEVDEIGKGGEVFTTYLPVEISGKFAEISAGDLEPGDEVQISGKLKYKSVVDGKTGTKVSKMIISSWGINQRIPALTTLAQDERSEEDPSKSMSDEPEHRPEAKPRRRSYPKQALQGGGFSSN